MTLFPGATLAPRMQASVTHEEFDIRDPLSPFWYGPVGEYAQTFSAFPIGPESAMRISAVFACVSLLSETFASFPCILSRRTDDKGGKERARDDRRYRTLRRRPNSWQNQINFFGNGQTDVGLRGRGLAKIIDDGRELRLEPMAASRTQIEQLSTGEPRYQYHNPLTRQRETLLADEVLDVKDLSLDGFTSIARASLAREAIAVAAAGEAFVGGFFKHDATGRIVFQHPGNLKQDKRDEFEKMISEKWAGWKNRSRPMLLTGEVEVKEIGTQDASKNFIVDPRKFQVTDVARFWRVPNILIGLEERSTSWGTGVEQQLIAFATFTMRAVTDRWAAALMQSLFTEEEQEEFVVEFLFDDLLRGDLATRAVAYRTFKEIGVLNPNEIRRKENMNRREGGDEYQEIPAGTAPGDRSAGGVEAHQIPTPLLADAAQRIAAADVREVRRRADWKAGPVRWRAWVEEHYASHREYVQTVLAPLAAAYSVAPDRVPAIAMAISDSGRAALAEGVPAGWLEGGRAAVVVALLEEGFTAPMAA